jgi:hypothetical protein
VSGLSDGQVSVFAELLLELLQQRCGRVLLRGLVAATSLPLAPGEAPPRLPGPARAALEAAEAPAAAAGADTECVAAAPARSGEGEVAMAGAGEGGVAAAVAGGEGSAGKRPLDEADAAGGGGSASKRPRLAEEVAAASPPGTADQGEGLQLSTGPHKRSRSRARAAAQDVPPGVQRGALARRPSRHRARPRLRRRVASVRRALLRRVAHGLPEGRGPGGGVLHDRAARSRQP